MSTQTTTQTTTQTAGTIAEIAAAALVRLADQVLVDQGRCVDVFLDLYGATEDVGLRWTIAQRLDDLRYLSLVDAEEMRADLHAIVAIAAGPDFAVPSAPAVRVAVPLAA